MNETKAALLFAGVIIFVFTVLVPVFVAWWRFLGIVSADCK